MEGLGNALSTGEPIVFTMDEEEKEEDIYSFMLHPRWRCATSHICGEKTQFVCYSLPNAPVWASAIFPDHFITANYNRSIDKQYLIKSNEQKRKELFRHLFVFLMTYFKYFEGEF